MAKQRSINIQNQHSVDSPYLILGNFFVLAMIILGWGFTYFGMWRDCYSFGPLFLSASVSAFGFLTTIINYIKPRNPFDGNEHMPQLQELSVSEEKVVKFLRPSKQARQLIIMAGIFLIVQSFLIFMILNHFFYPKKDNDFYKFQSSEFVNEKRPGLLLKVLKDSGFIITGWEEPVDKLNMLLDSDVFYKVLLKKIVDHELSLPRGININQLSANQLEHRSYNVRAVLEENFPQQMPRHPNKTNALIVGCFLYALLSYLFYCFILERYIFIQWDKICREE